MEPSSIIALCALGFTSVNILWSIYRDSKKTDKEFSINLRDELLECKRMCRECEERERQNLLRFEAMIKKEVEYLKMIFKLSENKDEK